MATGRIAEGDDRASRSHPEANSSPIAEPDPTGRAIGSPGGGEASCSGFVSRGCCCDASHYVGDSRQGGA